ncbi:LuxR C-terminal-related transcriptional regulator [Arthrobacter sp. zg-Y820]|uniref:helix-turn-helix transcriptional regulator n=1 Tax=unclassified Arthrobacter TaxID=235627 RepID=UPI0025413AAD|nr:MULTISPECIES: LuxR C-terminal-related transcriptional regulator [unclassified Arthrobacter]MCC9197238.1 LuxR C-terminal-related transcriptional regulator [Arthrobacter sp. zg-Y820]MDK1280103.1 LuxR C-terminal-related transcriptional regulator [Arthrobacter sp. zg.Y820]WIB09396.1 LuxR C-terminal-related transcriptional regulator [Arthrobacter sp. zg-Y820]
MDDVCLAVYRYAVSSPGWRVDEASEALGFTTRSIESAIEQLMERRLLMRANEGPRSRFAAVSPDVALAELVDPDERALLDLRSRIAATRRELAGLAHVFAEASRQASTDAAVEVLEDPDQVMSVLIEYGRSASDCVLMARPGPGATADAQEESIQKDVDLLRQGVRRRTLYHSSIRDHMPTRRAVEIVTAAGGEFRTLPHMLLRIVIFDGKVAVVPRARCADDRAGLVIRDPHLIHLFVRMFDFAWELGEPFLAEDPQPGQLSSLQRSILRALASGQSDEVIARRLGISVRTCRRHIAKMLEDLGAESRFQAGVKAHRAGWI